MISICCQYISLCVIEYYFYRIVYAALLEEKFSPVYWKSLEIDTKI